MLRSHYRSQAPPGCHRQRHQGRRLDLLLHHNGAIRWLHRCDVLRERRHSAAGDAAADEGLVYTTSVSACSTSFTSLISNGSTWQTSDGEVITTCWATKKSRACWLGMSAGKGVWSVSRARERG